MIRGKFIEDAKQALARVKEVGEKIDWYDVDPMMLDSEATAANLMLQSIDFDTACDDAYDALYRAGVTANRDSFRHDMEHGCFQEYEDKLWQQERMVLRDGAGLDGRTDEYNAFEQRIAGGLNTQSSHSYMMSAVAVLIGNRVGADEVSSDMVRQHRDMLLANMTKYVGYSPRAAEQAIQSTFFNEGDDLGDVLHKAEALSLRLTAKGVAHAGREAAARVTLVNPVTMAAQNPYSAATDAQKAELFEASERYEGKLAETKGTIAYYMAQEACDQYCSTVRFLSENTLHDIETRRLESGHMGDERGLSSNMSHRLGWGMSMEQLAHEQEMLFDYVRSVKDEAVAYAKDTIIETDGLNNARLDDRIRYTDTFTEMLNKDALARGARVTGLSDLIDSEVSAEGAAAKQAVDEFFDEMDAQRALDRALAADEAAHAPNSDLQHGPSLDLTAPVEVVGGDEGLGDGNLRGDTPEFEVVIPLETDDGSKQFEDYIDLSDDEPEDTGFELE